MRNIDNFLNNITMYRLVLYGLTVISAFVLVLSAFSFLPFNFWYLLGGLALLIGSCFAFNSILARIYKIPANVESFYITAFILFLILPPPSSWREALGFVVCALVAMLSKFIINYNGKHIFNPAAFALFVITFTGLTTPAWGVASKPLFIVTAVVGLLIARKIRMLGLISCFIAVTFVLVSVVNMNYGSSLVESVSVALFSFPMIFLGTVMLTEPLTSPPTRNLRIVYGGIVAVLFSLPWRIGPLYATPELALLIGNIFAFWVSPKVRLTLKLKEKIQMAPQVFDFVFQPSRQFAFEAGQYLEWTLGHKDSDSRGNRRCFTIASSPTEKEIHIGVKVPSTSSSFKKALTSMKPGDELLAGSLAGDFTLPKSGSKKFVAIAGGIGITPFRSMVKKFLDTNTKTDMVLFYASADPEEFVYQDVFKQAEQVGVKTVHVLSGAKQVPTNWQGKTGYLNEEIIKAEVPDYSVREYYLSGPNAMVESYKKLLKSMGISSGHIHTDYFPGY